MLSQVASGNFIIAEMERIKPFEEDNSGPAAAAPIAHQQSPVDDVLSFSVPDWLKSLGYDICMSFYIFLSCRKLTLLWKRHSGIHGPRL